jgi:hypothetical protein
MLAMAGDTESEVVVPPEGRQAGCYLRLLGCERLHGAAMEDLALDRTVFEVRHELIRPDPPQFPRTSASSTPSSPSRETPRASVEAELAECVAQPGFAVVPALAGRSRPVAATTRGRERQGPAAEETAALRGLEDLEDKSIADAHAAIDELFAKRREIAA